MADLIPCVVVVLRTTSIAPSKSMLEYIELGVVARQTVLITEAIASITVGITF